MNDLTNLVQREEARLKIILDRIANNNEVPQNYLESINAYHYKKAILSIQNSEFKEAKFNFNLCSLIDIYNVKKFNNTFLGYALQKTSFPLLSDNELTMQKYSKLAYKPQGQLNGFLENVDLGLNDIWCHTVQMLMIENFERVEKNLSIIETKTLPRLSKKEELLKIDFEIFRSLLAKEKSQCEELIYRLISPLVHKKRNENVLLSKYISQPAIGYAKLAWKLGIKVNIDSPLIAKEMLPVNPLVEYPNPYQFLNEVLSK